MPTSLLTSEKRFDFGSEKDVWSLLEAVPEAAKQQHKPKTYYVDSIAFIRSDPQISLLPGVPAFEPLAHEAASLVQHFVAEVVRRTSREIATTVTRRALADALVRLDWLGRQHQALCSRVELLERTQPQERELVVIDTGAVASFLRELIPQEFGFHAVVEAAAESGVVRVVVTEEYENALAEQTATIYEAISGRFGAAVFRALTFDFDVVDQ